MKTGKIILAGLFLFSLFILSGCHERRDNLSGKSSDSWPEIKNTMKPWTRWWWMGSAVDRKNIKSLLRTYSEAGFGGVEITPIYGVVGNEGSYVPFLSREWIRLLKYSIRQAGSNDMEVDMNLGTGWPFGGPQISSQFAAARLLVQKYFVQNGRPLTEKLVVKDTAQKSLGAELVAVTGYKGWNERIDLTAKVSDDGSLNWNPGDGNWEIYAVFSGKTGQQVKRAAPGGEGLTMDHFSEEALNAYLKRFDDAFGRRSPGVRAYFNDSYEVYNADFSPDFINEFEKMKGYDLRLYIRELLCREKSDNILRIKADYHDAMSQMLLYNFTIPWSRWIHGRKALSRNQAHGSPGNLLDLYSAVDIPECETFGSTGFQIPGFKRYSMDTRNEPPDPVMLKFASSAGNITGKPLISSETFTWLGEHFKVALAQCKPEVEQVFLSGINHVIYHGTTYSPHNAEWPGWLFYASVEFVPSNSLWPHIRGLNEYITRCQSVLQSGKPDNELLVYWPVQDIWHHCDPGKLDFQLGIDNLNEWLKSTDFYATVNDLMSAGYSVDFVSDRLLDSLKVFNGQVGYPGSGTFYKALIIPRVDFMPLSSMEKILSLARSGGITVFRQLPVNVPGFHNKDSRRNLLGKLLSGITFKTGENGISEMSSGNGSLMLADDLHAALKSKDINPETLVESGLKFIRRKAGGSKYYYLVNHTPDMIDSWLMLNTEGKMVMIMDPLSGKTGIADATPIKNKIQVRVKLKSGESVILRTFNEVVKGERWTYQGMEKLPIIISGTWNLKFIQGGPGIPGEQNLSELVSWTDLNDTSACNFSGTAIYKINFRLVEKNRDEYILKLGDVRESAHVWVNNKDAGILWSAPFEVRIGQFLKRGENTLTIGVVNLMANRIRDMDRKKISWRKFHEINFVDLNYKPFDASGWEPQPSGLLGPVSLLPVELN